LFRGQRWLTGKDVCTIFLKVRIDVGRVLAPILTIVVRHVSGTNMEKGFILVYRLVQSVVVHFSFSQNHKDGVDFRNEIKILFPK
jgi:hypothetical protein